MGKLPVGDYRYLDEKEVEEFEENILNIGENRRIATPFTFILLLQTFGNILNFNTSKNISVY